MHVRLAGQWSLDRWRRVRDPRPVVRRQALVRTLTVGLVAAGVLAGACACASGGSPTAYPDGIVVMGHSGATGYDSNPLNREADAPENSWATGDNPAVNSIYRRILARHPAIEGHAFNVARSGSDVNDLMRQARIAVSTSAGSRLVRHPVRGQRHPVRRDGRRELRTVRHNAATHTGVHQRASPQGADLHDQPVGHRRELHECDQGDPRQARRGERQRALQCVRSVRADPACRNNRVAGARRRLPRPDRLDLRQRP